jgi:hypothetical protein
MPQQFDKDNDVRFINVHEDPPGTLVGRVPFDDPKSGAAFGARIATFLALQTSLEAITPDVFAAALGVGAKEAGAVLEQISSYASRLDAIERVAEIRTPPKQQFITQFVKEMRWVNAERNKYMHALYGVGSDTYSLYRGEWVMQARDTKWTVLTLEKIDADIQRARVLVGMAWTHFAPAPTK